MKKPKKCRRCGITKPPSEFVDATGEENPRGHYCKLCHAEIARECRDTALEEEKAKIPKLKIIYGEYWKHWAFPHDFEATLHEERNFCPYCGKPLPPQYMSKRQAVGPFRGRAHLDHMDPLSKGGEDSIRNVVYVCDRCNNDKLKLLFTEWLKKLLPEFRELARNIYVQKHGHEPEQFEAGDPVPRTDGLTAELFLDEQELKEMYPRPIFDGPPSNKIDIKIEASLSDLLDISEIRNLFDKHET